MTDATDLSSRALKRYYVRQLRWLWRHDSWRGSTAYTGDTGNWIKKGEAFGERQSRANYAHRLLKERGWAVGT